MVPKGRTSGVDQSRRKGIAVERMAKEGGLRVQDLDPTKGAKF